MDFNFTEAQEMLRETVRRFVEAEIPAAGGRRDRPTRQLPHELLGKLCDLGFMGIKCRRNTVGRAGM